MPHGLLRARAPTAKRAALSIRRGSGVDPFDVRRRGFKDVASLEDDAKLVLDTPSDRRGSTWEGSCSAPAQTNSESTSRGAVAFAGLPLGWREQKAAIRDLANDRTGWGHAHPFLPKPLPVVLVDSDSSIGRGTEVLGHTRRARDPPHLSRTLRKCRGRESSSSSHNP